ncbi:MAG: beta-lactamase family protein [Candidatus Bathyarchaeota archaeon]|nr:beta-lactamase family protein [Candidatus Bathyarchaeota archaeon]MDH5786906.1 beta-lactamase family protein [Candidatus Bathyarchaeota archaeon]
MLRIKERIERVENNLKEVEYKDGLNIAFSGGKVSILERMQSFKVPGVSISVINDYEVEWAKSYGVKDVRTENIATTDTLFEAGSTSKALTAAAILHLVERKSLDLDGSVNDKLVTWKIPNNEYTGETKINLRHLLTHTSGINRPDGGFEIEKEKTPTLNQVLNGESPAVNGPVKVLTFPGKKHDYSNFGYLIIQKLLEDVTGTPFSAIMSKIVFKPLEMNNSTFEYPSEELKKKATVPHDEKGEAKEPGLHPTALAQGGLLTTPLDLGKYVVELMNAFNGKSSRILSSSMVKKMFTPEISLNPKEFMGITGQGLGIFIIEKEKDVFFTHPGVNMPGATCNMMGCAETGQGTVIMTNGINGSLLSLEILFSIAQEYKWSLWANQLESV